MNLQDFINNATELAHTIIESGLYEGTGIHKIAEEIIDRSDNADTLITQHYDSTDRIALIWGIDDVKFQADELGIELSDQQAFDILHDINRKHDASIGVNWDVIKCYIDIHKND